MLTKKYYFNLFKVLEKKEKINFLKFAFFVLLIVFLETIGLGLIYPILQSLTNNEINENFSKLYDLSKNFVNLNIDIDIFILSLFALVIILKNLFFFYFEFWQLTFLRNFKISLKKRLLKLHFQNDYEKTSRNKISTYIRDFNSTIEQFIKSIQISMQLLTEIFIFFGLIFLLLIIQSSQILMFAIVIGLIALIFSLILRKTLSKFGQKSLDIQQKSLAKFIDMINSTKEIIAFGKYPIFIKQYTNLETKTLNINRIVNLIQKFPKYFFEVLIVLSFTFFIFYSKSKSVNLTEMLPQLGIILLAVLKLLPSITKALFYVQKLNVAEASSSKIADDINLYKRFENIKNYNSKTPIMFEKSISLKNISFKYAVKDFEVLNNINLEINKGDFIGIYGPSGGGKSTLIDIICGFLNPTQGQIFVDEKKIDRLSDTDWLKRIGLLTQENNILDDTIINNITLEFDSSKVDINFLEKIIKEVGLEQMVKNSSNGYHSEVGQNAIAVSGGEKQRLGIARALYANKQILIFDESTSNLDEINKDKFIEVINVLSKNNTIIIISHDKDVIKNCKKKYIIEDKKLILSS